MSTRIADGDILKVTVVVVGQESQVALPSFHFRVGITTGSPQDVDLANSVDSACNVNLAPLLSNAADYRGVLVQRIAPLPVMRRSFSNTGATAGTGGAGLAPQQAAPIVKIGTTLAGPGFRGRFFIPFPPSTIIDAANGIIVSTYVTKMVTFIQSIFAIGTVGGGGNVAAVYLGVYHRETLTITDASDVDAQVLCGTQRKRGDWGKTNVSPL